MTMASDMRIDGSYGEGGGQLLRTALALSAITGRPLALANIRVGRTKPGLGNQHLAAVRAVAQITQAEVEGDRLGSTTLRFAPGPIRAGSFAWDVAQERGSAGSVTLVLQAVLPVLCHAPGPSLLILRGGTHVPWSPPVHYVQAVLLPMLARLGVHADVELTQAGWYPKGGGEMRVTVQPCSAIQPARWISRGALQRIHGWSLLSNLSPSIADRQRQAVERAVRRHHLTVPMEIECAGLPSSGQGTCVMVQTLFKHGTAGFSSLGKLGKPAEQVGREAAEALLAHLATEAALDEHLADQLIVFMAQAGGPSEFSTARITSHLRTALWVVEQCLPVRTRVEGIEGQPGTVTLEPLTAASGNRSGGPTAA